IAMPSDLLSRARTVAASNRREPDGCTTWGACFQGCCGGFAITWLRFSAVLRLISTIFAFIFGLFMHTENKSDLNPTMEKLFLLNALVTGLLWAVAFAGKAVCFPVYVILEIVFSFAFPYFFMDNLMKYKKPMQKEEDFIGTPFLFIMGLVLVINVIVVLLLALGGYHSHLKREEVAEKEELIMRAMQRKPENNA
ncbi:hypothetical protein PFISCL1PPCAC_5325, partial [Pristionchus fissidentatus]